jgi:hypothetical protein
MVREASAPRRGNSLNDASQRRLRVFAPNYPDLEISRRLCIRGLASRWSAAPT